MLLGEGEDPKSNLKGELLFLVPSPECSHSGRVAGVPQRKSSCALSRPADENKVMFIAEKISYLKKAREMGSFISNESFPTGHQCFSFLLVIANQPSPKTKVSSSRS